MAKTVAYAQTGPGGAALYPITPYMFTCFSPVAGTVTAPNNNVSTLSYVASVEAYEVP